MLQNKIGIPPTKLKGWEKNESYFTCGGLIIQADVSKLSVCATNNRLRKTERVRSRITSPNHYSMY